MSVIKYESWDSVTAPTVPTDWNTSAPAGVLVTSTGSGGLIPTSSPNALASSGTFGTHNLATWNTADGVSGDVTVKSNIAWTGLNALALGGVVARGSASTLVWGSTDYYLAYCDPVAGTASIAKVVGLTLTDLFTTSIPGALVDTTWYQFTFTLNGTSLSFYVMRISDGMWLDSAGSWVAGQTAVASGTDGSLSGSGYFGTFSYVDTTTVWFDDTYLTTIVDPFTHATMYDRVKESSLTLGIGPMLLLGAETGYQSFAIVGDGNYVYYGIADQLSNDWEVGLGSYDASGPSLNRLVVYDSSVGPGSFVDFQTGSYKSIFNTVPAWLLNSLMGLL